MNAQDKAAFFDVSLQMATRNGKAAEWLAYALEQAAFNGDADFTKKLLMHGASPLTICSGGDCVLHVAVAAGNHFVAHVLLDHGADVDVPGRYGHSALQLAVMSDQLLMVAALLARKASVNYRSHQSTSTALELAAEEGLVDVMQILLDNDADVDAADAGGTTALHQAAMGGHAGAIRLLVEAGADPNKKDGGGWTPLHAASSRNSGECVKALCVLRTEKNKLDSSGQTPLQMAITLQAFDAVRELLIAGADVELRHRVTETSALDLAASSGCVEMVEILLDNGANIAAVDSGGQTALLMVHQNDHFGVASMLVQKGADVNARDNHGRTALHHASWWQAIGTMNVLLAHDAKVNVRDDFGELPLHLAARSSDRGSSAPVVDLLLKCGADEAAINQDGLTAAGVLGYDVPPQGLNPNDPLTNEVVLDLLAKAPTARKERAWRRRGLPVMIRARLNKARKKLSTGDGASSGGDCGGASKKRPRLASMGGGVDAAGDVTVAADDVDCEVKRVVEIEGDDIFRKVIGFL